MTGPISTPGSRPFPTRRRKAASASVSRKTLPAPSTRTTFAAAGQRCLAAANVVLVDGAGKVFRETLAEAALRRRVGNGLEPGVEMGPVITPQSKRRIEGLIQRG